MISQGVYTRMKRVAFKKGWLTGGTDPEDGSVECGPRTAYCLKVTLRQLAEIVYRVKDARFSGELGAVYGFASISMKFSEGAMPDDYYSGSMDDVVVERSYADTEYPPQNLVGERSIWTVNKSSPTNSSAPHYVSHGLITGFTHYAESYVFPASGYHPYGEVYSGGYTAGPYPAEVEAAFGQAGADYQYVAVTGDGNPLDPANEIWMQFRFIGFTWDSDIVALDVYTEAEYGEHEADAGLLTIVLSEEVEITCQLLHSFGDSATPSSSLKLTATEWWPYAAGSPALPVWESETGVKIPAAAVFASLAEDPEAIAYVTLF